ncbi:RmlC-like cupin domain-containing protein [Aspergillus ambiguus]|uniref:cupin domain-containing protein n=1 Tax=Aspergillus ambiguus TaxID=176160 RepID=UPI003CCD9348
MPSITELSSPAVAKKLDALSSRVTDKPSLEAEIKTQGLVPLWNTGAPISAPIPRSKQVPTVWHYADTKSLLLQAAKLVDAREAERRAVLMINPGRNESPFTLDTLLAAHQLILPGEKAVCHRHTPFAVRFLIEGESGYTAISGRKMYMRPGDLIITPVWNWHDHGNDGSENIIWLDGLNIPLFKPFPVDFTEHYLEEFGRDTHPSDTFPDTDELVAQMKFPWTEMQARLDAEPGDAVVREYLLPASGKSVSTTIGAYAERISAGKASARRKETTNHVFQVHRGAGRTEVTNLDGSKSTLRWGPGDSFALPSWHEFRNFADADETVYLFFFSDKPMLTNLGFWREG